jgi:hypothetical protein
MTREGLVGSSFAVASDNRGQLLGAGQLGVGLVGKFAFDVIRQIIAPALSDHVQRVHEF